MTDSDAEKRELLKKLVGCKGDATYTSRNRKPPGKRVRDRILERQDNRCLYCQMPFGSEVIRKYSYVYLRLQWDHFVPHAYLGRRAEDNWAAACHVCNGIKASRVFESLDEARRFIVNRAIEKGYHYPRPEAHGEPGEAQEGSQWDR